MEFTEDEVQDKLRELGYHNVPREKLLEFMADLEELIQLDLSGAASSVTDEAETSEVDTTGLELPLRDVNNKSQPKAFAKEKMKSHYISFDKENLPLFDREDIPVYDSSAIQDTLSSTLISTDDCDKSMRDSSMKRKVVRKRNGSTRIFDESSANDDTMLSDITAAEEKLRNLPLREEERRSVSSSASSFRKTRSKSMSSVNSVNESSVSESLPAFIRPSRKHPHTKNLSKSDPVSRFHHFNKEWKGNRFPGESSHSNLRWNVRERMLHCEVFEKPRRQPTTNNYVVPTEKKRQALRWQVRTALAKI